MTMRLKDRLQQWTARFKKEADIGPTKVSYSANAGVAPQPFRFGKGSMLAVVVLSFLIGYNMITSQVTVCMAQGQVPPAGPVVVVGGTCFLSVPPYCNPVLCEPSGTASGARSTIWQAFKNTLETLTNTTPPFMAQQNGGGTVNSGNGLEGYLGGTVDQMMMALLDRLNDIELEYIDWFDTMWFYNLEPAMKDMTDQVNTATVDQTQTFQGGQDGQDEDQVNQSVMKQEQVNQTVLQPSENGPCVAATSSGGSARGYVISRELKKAFQKETFDDALNKKGTVAALGRGAKAKLRNDNYKSVTCNPDDNGGSNNCAGSTSALYNADTQLSRTVYNNLTIPLDGADGDKYETAVKSMLDNMTGDTVADPIVPAALQSSQGQQEFMDRRSHVARMAAIRALPQLGISWRSPGTKLDTYVKDLRKDSGTADGDISTNPSYKEALHAVSIDRFNSGQYALNTAGGPAEIEMEKLTVDSFYLMQLRDYNELLERMALALAVQVSIMVDQLSLPLPKSSKPIKAP
ncbi:MAG: hypothetical protein PW788_02025 [Micavibrio sp.]|nr:hypothetical protein [Micavibrio sp.]